MVLNCLHLRIDDPVKVLVAFVGATWSALNWAEEPGVPVDSFIGALGSFFALAVFYFGFFIGCGFVVPGYDCLHGVVP
jgi:hypothetical protein